MTTNIIDKLSKKFEKTPEEVIAFIDELMFHLHKEFYEYNGDIIGGNLYFSLGSESYFHFLGLLSC